MQENDVFGFFVGFYIMTAACSGDDYTLKLRLLRFAASDTKCVSNCNWTGDEVKLLLRKANEYEVAKSAEMSNVSPYIKRYNGIFWRQTEAVFKDTVILVCTAYETVSFSKGCTFDDVFERCGFIYIPSSPCKRKA